MSSDETDYIIWQCWQFLIHCRNNTTDMNQETLHSLRSTRSVQILVVIIIIIT